MKPKHNWKKTMITKNIIVYLIKLYSFPMRISSMIILDKYGRGILISDISKIFPIRKTNNILFLFVNFLKKLGYIFNTPFLIEKLLL